MNSNEIKGKKEMKKERFSFSSKGITTLTANRIIYFTILLAVVFFAWMYGERLFYVTLAVLIALPVISYIITFIFLFGFRISQTIPKTIVKGEVGVISVLLHNATFMPFGQVECLFISNQYTIEIQEYFTTTSNPFTSTTVEVNFNALYRGEYVLGLKAVRVVDLMGLFRLKKRYRQVNAKRRSWWNRTSIENTILVVPRITELSQFQLSFNLLTEAFSRFDMRDEDYSTVSDIRPYLPSDSIKRVHWKLTAKRNEWLVKIFQSNALNRVIIILDTMKLPLHQSIRYPLEDNKVEMVVGLSRYCLIKGMPVDFFTSGGNKASARGFAEFDIIYQVACGLKFESSPTLSTLSILNHVINDTTGYINAIILTTKLDKDLYERIITAYNNGHYIVVLYYSTSESGGSTESEEIYKLLLDAQVTCYRHSN